MKKEILLTACGFMVVVGSLLGFSPALFDAVVHKKDFSFPGAWTVLFYYIVPFLVSLFSQIHCQKRFKLFKPFETALGKLKNPFYINDEQGDICFANHQLVKWVGIFLERNVTVEDINRMNVTDLFKLFGFEGHIKEIREIFDQYGEVTLENSILGDRVQGHHRWYHISAWNPSVTDTCMPTQGMFMLQDISRTSESKDQNRAY